MGKHRDWTEIRDDYQLNGLSYAKLAAKYNVPIDTLKKAAARQGWTKRKEKKERAESIKARRVEKAFAAVEMAPAQNGTEEMAPDEPGPGVSEAERFQGIVSSLLAKLALAADRVDPRDTKGMRAISGAMKDLAALKGWNKDELDRQEQRARIEKLRADTSSAADAASREVTIRFVDTEGAEE